MNQNLPPDLTLPAHPPGFCDPAWVEGFRRYVDAFLDRYREPMFFTPVNEPMITASCVEATEFMDLSRKFHVTGVPKTIVNGSIEILGALPEDQFVRTVVGAPDGDAGSTH